jgi:hypothetical protein
MKRVLARTTILVLAIGVSGGCASATISADASSASAYVVHKKMFNQYMMRCTAENPNQPVCTVLQEQE